MEREELAALVEDELTVRQIAEQVGKGYSTVRYWLKKHGLQTKHRGPGRASRIEAGERICIRHGRVQFIRDSHGTRCSKCRSASNCHKEVEGGVKTLEGAVSRVVAGLRAV